MNNHDLLLIRRWFTTKSTIAEVWTNTPDGSEFLCYTLEDEARPSGVKIEKHTCIPAGDYRIQVTWSNRFKRPLPIIYNQEDLTIKDYDHTWSGVRFHPGNLPDHTEGCPLPGMTRSVDRVDGSRIAFDEKLFPYIQNHAALRAIGYLKLLIINKQANPS